MTGQRVRILLPVHNRVEITARFVQCLKRQTYPDWSLILIDDGSTDGTEEVVCREIAGVTVIKGRGDWWWGGALQQGYLWIMSASGVLPGDIVMIANDDTHFEEDFLERAVTILGGRNDILLLAECFSAASGKFLDGGIHADWARLRFVHAEKPEDTNCLSTMGLFLTVEAFRKIGGFYPRLIPHFVSDYEFTIRAHRKGFTLVTDPALKLWLNEQTTWNRKDDEESFRAFLRNLFSNRSPVNPVVWTFFVALACPWRWKMVNLYRVWMGAFFLIVSRAVRHVRGTGRPCSGSKRERGKA